MSDVDLQALWHELSMAQPLKRIKVGDVEVRPLAPSDLEELCSFMLNDPEMNWPRVPWDRDNVDYVLNLRLEHYQKYGFGMYAVESGGHVIGWSGAQVADEADGSVEVVCFLARSEWGKGLGTELILWTIDSIFAKTRLRQLFAFTRPENPAGSAIAARVGFVKVGTAEHFGFNSIVWQIDPEGVMRAK